jgi:hypothetical protein
MSDQDLEMIVEEQQPSVFNKMSKAQYRDDIFSQIWIVDTETISFHRYG